MSGKKIYIILNLILLICFNCTSIFYHPTDYEYYSPKRFNLKYEDIYYLTKDNIKLHGYYLYNKRPEISKDTIIVYFHGNAQNISSHYLGIYWITNYGYDVIIWDYRGFGKSEGKVEHKKNFFDVKELIDYSVELALKKNKKVILWGQSLGGAILITSFVMSKYLNHEKVLALIIDSSFDSYHQIINIHSDIYCLIPFRFIVKEFYDEKYSPINYIKLIYKPIIFIYGTDDPVVPYYMGLRLFEAANSPKIFISVQGGNHSNWMFFGNSQTAKTLLKLLEQISSIKDDQFLVVPFID
ncbi:MAG: phospholipase [Leptospiraceae bacterium]|nr:MAG: phospholipase [Leptospiraceae bacterium]